MDDYEEEYRQSFRAVRPIFEKDLSSVEDRRIPMDILNALSAFGKK
jgi:hypothetical protein